MRLALAALFLIACDPETQEGTDPDLSRYALQADLDAALVEIDELRAATLMPAVLVDECAEGVSEVSIELQEAVTVLSVSLCKLDNEGDNTEVKLCTSASHLVATPTGAALGYAQRIDVTCSEGWPDVEVVYLPAAE